MPAYIVFDDRTLREMARCKPCTWEGLLDIKGVGRKKRDRYGRVFLGTIKDYCTEDRRGKPRHDIELVNDT
ncbi:MAG: HRDC domain-containing protein [Phycisphaerales bacterium]|nr:MAG: HRDC domain-containing protein [Phycisphaerales bacterium]